MKISILLILLSIVGCGPRTVQSFTSPNYRTKCEIACKKDFGTALDYIGDYSGRCYCK